MSLQPEKKVHSLTPDEISKLVKPLPPDGFSKLVKAMDETLLPLSAAAVLSAPEEDWYRIAWHLPFGYSEERYFAE